MDPNHLITAGLIFLGFAVIFGIRHYVNFQRSQKNQSADTSLVGRTETDQVDSDGGA